MPALGGGGLAWLVGRIANRFATHLASSIEPGYVGSANVEVYLDLSSFTLHGKQSTRRTRAIYASLTYVWTLYTTPCSIEAGSTKCWVSYLSRHGLSCEKR
jgi:hypothetical protein